MKRDVMRWCQECYACQQVKSRPGGGCQPLKQEPVGAPFERVAMDIMEPGVVTEKGNRYILVISDYYTKWVEAYPLQNHTAQTVADVMVTEFCCRFGVPQQIHSDQGTEFESKLMKELCTLLQSHKTRTTPYRPQSDGLVERLNRSIIALLTTVVNEHQDDWDDWLSPTVRRCTSRRVVSRI
jgi:transposase InsO family protein